MAYLRFFLTLILLLIVSFSIMTQDDTPRFFALVSDEPTVPNGTGDDWDSVYTDPGVVIYHDGQFHMFRNGFNSWPGFVGIGYLTSPDGITWTEADTEPIFLTSDVPYAEVAILSASAIVEDDGTWVLYLTIVNRQGGEPGSIARATADNPLGPWTPDEAPVLTVGSAGSWDDGYVASPHVEKTDDGYIMYYEGGDAQNKLFASQIGMATSEDGIIWMKHDDPATDDALFAESDPILSPIEGEMFIHQPLVQQTPDGWVMVYRILISRGNMALGIAFSEDGMRWERAPDPIFWGRRDIPSTQGFWDTAMAYHDGTYYLYIEAGSSQTQIYTATYEGRLKDM